MRLNKLKRNVLLFLLSFGAINLFAQNDYSTVEKSFTQYVSYSLQEKVFVHTDKTFYIVGELLWFKIYNVDEATHQLLNISKVAYIEVIDVTNKPILQAMIKLEGGTGKGSFHLPVSLNSGSYKLRAYTALMKNFSADFYYEKQITIVNSLKTLKLSFADTIASYDVRFFPEGGNLVKNIESKVAFKITDKNGKGVEFIGILVNENNDTVVGFRPLKFGMGHFLFTPSGSHTYKAIIKLEDGKTLEQELPAVYEQGYVMSFHQRETNRLIIEVKTNIADAKNVFLFVHTRQVLKEASSSAFNNGIAQFSIDKNNLGDGVSQLTIFNEMKQPVCERLYFKNPEHRLLVEVVSDKQQYALREKISLNLTTKDDKNNLLPADLSMSVYRLDSLQSMVDENIVNYLWLTSDLRGIIESPGYYFTNKSSEVEEAVDNLMLTQGWRRFEWNTVLKNEIPSFQYLPEYSGHQIIGKVNDKKTGLPAADIQTYLSVPGINPKFYESKSDSKGTINFDVKELYGSNEIIVQTNSLNDSLQNITILSPFSEKYSSNTLPDFNLSENILQDLAKLNVSMQVQNAFVKEKWQQFNLPFIDSIPFYGRPTRQYLLDDYTRFPTMEEVFREYVLEVGVRKRGGDFHLFVLNEVNKGFYDDDPLMLLDGIPLFSGDKILKYEPLKIRKLDVVTNRYSYGNLSFDGIINLSTYNGNIEGLQLDPRTVIINYEGLQLNREFYAPAYKTEQQVNSRMPDFRNVLFWSPDIKTNKDGQTPIEFYTSDLPGKYMVVVQGLNDEGKAGYGSFTFEVHENK